MIGHEHGMLVDSRQFGPDAGNLTVARRRRQFEDADEHRPRSRESSARQKRLDFGFVEAVLVGDFKHIFRDD